MKELKFWANQAFGPGLTTLKTKLSKYFSSPERQNLLVWTVCLILICLFSDNMNAQAFTGTRLDLSDMSRGNMMRYARSMQQGVAENPDLLTSLKGEDVRLILAAPEMERVDGPTTVWQYRTSSCILDVYFTVKGDHNADEVGVTHYEVRGREIGADAHAAACMSELYDVRQSQIAEAFKMIFAAYDDPQST